MSTPRKRPGPVVMELLIAAENALATATALQGDATEKRRKIGKILEGLGDDQHEIADWIKRYPDTAAKAIAKLQLLEAQSARWEADAQTYRSEAQRLVMAAQTAHKND